MKQKKQPKTASESIQRSSDYWAAKLPERLAARGAQTADEIVRDPNDPLDFLFDSERELPPESIGLGSDKYVVSVDTEEVHKEINRALGDPEHREVLRQEREQHKQWREDANAALKKRMEENK